MGRTFAASFREIPDIPEFFGRPKLTTWQSHQFGFNMDGAFLIRYRVFLLSTIYLLHVSTKPMCEISPKWRIWGEIYSKQVRHHRRRFSFSKEFSSIIFPAPKISVMEHP